MGSSDIPTDAIISIRVGQTMRPLCVLFRYGIPYGCSIMAGWAPAPAMGQYTGEILGDVLGCPMERITALEQQPITRSVGA